MQTLDTSSKMQTHTCWDFKIELLHQSLHLFQIIWLRSELVVIIRVWKIWKISKWREKNTSKQQDELKENLHIKRLSCGLLDVVSTYAQSSHCGELVVLWDIHLCQCYETCLIFKEKAGKATFTPFYTGRLSALSACSVIDWSTCFNGCLWIKLN